jgi:hypothetical protein
LWQEKRSTEKVTYYQRLHLVFFSNRCLNFDRPFKTISDGARSMSKRMLLLTAGVLATGLAGIVMAGQPRQAPKQSVYPVHATPELMQLSRDEHDLIAEMIKSQLAAERSQLPKQEWQVAPIPS